MQVITIVARWIKFSILVNMNGYVQHVWIIFEGLLDAVAYFSQEEYPARVKGTGTMVNVPRFGQR